MGVHMDGLDDTARSMLTGGRPEAFGELVGHDWRRFRGRPWVRLGVTAALIARDPGDPESVEALASCRRSFERTGDTVGCAYVAYVAGNRALGRGDYLAAGEEWAKACDLAGVEAPVGCHALANLSLVAFHAGDLGLAARTAEQSLAVARLGLDRRGEAVALLYGALANLALGNFAMCMQQADAADRVLVELPDTLDRFEWPLAPLARSMAHWWRGEPTAALGEANCAVDRAVEVEAKWYESMALATLAEISAPTDPIGALGIGRRALTLAREVGDPWWESAALRAVGVATSHAGQHLGAERLLSEAVQLSPGPFERARCSVVLGEALARAHKQTDAIEVLTDATEVLRAAGAKYWAYRALRTLIALDYHSGRSWIGLARSLRGSDPAFDVIDNELMTFIDRAIEVRCVGHMEILTDGEPIVFLTQHAQRATVMLALAGLAGIREDKVVDLLWPQVPPGRAAQRLRTLLWQMRKALAPYGDALVRTQGLLRIEPALVTVDLLELLAKARRLPANAPNGSAVALEVSDLADQLSSSVLEQYQYEDWAHAWITKAELAAVALSAPELP